MKTAVRKIIRKFGYDLVSFDPRFNYEAKKIHLLNKFAINHVLDVGANTGQFGAYLRKLGYSGKITSFEPIKEAYRILEQVTDPDPLWTTVCAGLGNENESAILNISQNSFSSSIKKISPLTLKVHPDSATVSRQKISLYALDSIFNKYVKSDSKVLLKIDTQGFESEVLAGAIKSLPKIDVIILEMSLESLYNEQELLPILMTKMKDFGFSVSILEPCDEDYKNLTILQVDGWFIKTTVKTLHNEK